MFDCNFSRPLLNHAAVSSSALDDNDGYEEILLKAAKEMFPETPYTRFGFFYSRNNTSTDGTYRMFTGEKGINRLGLLDTWNNQKTNNKWFGKRCQRFDGISAGDFQPPYRHPKPKSIDIFMGDFCRPFTLEFAKEVDCQGIKCSRYWASPTLFDYNLPDNQCYCQSNSCPANGVMNVSVCTMGSPTAVSFPHFLYADNIYLDSVNGLSPDPNKHSFYMDFDDTLGVPLNVAVRLQVNIVVEKNQNLDFSRNFTQKPLYFPQFWFSTTAKVGEDMVQQLNFLVNLVPFYINIISFLFLLIGFLTLVSAAVYAFRSKRNICNNNNVVVIIRKMSANFSNYDKCGAINLNHGLRDQSRVGGEQTADDNEFPFMVSLEAKDKHFCGGTVLNKRWILTAAHCIRLTQLIQKISEPKDIKLVMGTVHLDLNSSGLNETYVAEKWIINGCFLSQLGDVLDGDIALIRADKDIPIDGQKVTAICLPPKDAEPAAEEAMMTGWGVWGPSGTEPSKILHKANTTIVSEEFCQMYEYFRNVGLLGRLPGKRICVMSEESTACFGDSGGPLIQVVNGKAYEIGIASYISGCRERK
ncbi:unnamed protein product [Oppiella nova]|uniref:Scavenger receptor class B member 1 n=1 Tax=Oppiella nova TaxID=334625 RepID=A0A7R9LWN3_9ACAR|nr:unnamed protein product [Oppiella nova]CAG2167710.1 unnamed protein product [Oppiella nova]